MTQKQRNNIMRSRNKKPLTEMTIAYCEDESQRYYFERMSRREFAMHCWLTVLSLCLVSALIIGAVSLFKPLFGK